MYATCSLLPQENEGVAQAWEAAHPEFEPVPVGPLLEGLKVPDAAGLCAGEGERWLRLWPHRHGTDGFFAAVWRKK